MQAEQAEEVDAHAEQRLAEDGNSDWLVKSLQLETKEGDIEAKQNPCEIQGKREGVAELHFL